MVSVINNTAYMDVIATRIIQSTESKEFEEVKQNAETNKSYADSLKEQLQTQMDSIRETNDIASKGTDILVKCMRIAMRIVQGDNIPQKDDQFLAEKNPELHMRAWMLRVPKDDPKNHDSELIDEDNETINQLNDFSHVEHADYIAF